MFTAPPATDPRITTPFDYRDASKQIAPGSKPDPLGRSFARGVLQPAIKVELSAEARKQLSVLAEADQSLEQALSEQYSDPGGFEPKPSLAASIMKSREEDSLKEALEIDTAQDRLRENLKKVQLNKAEPILSSGVSREYAYAAYDRTAS